MRNVTAEIKGTKLVLTVDLSKEYGYSKSGKTIQVGSTLGNQPVDSLSEQYQGYAFGLNVYRYPQG